MLPFATTWIKLKDIILSAVSQREKNTIHVWSHLYGESKKKSQAQKVEWWFPGAGDCRRWAESGQRTQGCSYKMNNLWGANV